MYVSQITTLRHSGIKGSSRSMLSDVNISFLVHLLWLLTPCHMYSFSDEVNLLTAIFPASYDRYIRPGENRSAPLQVNVTFYFKSIKEFDESISKFSVTGALGVFWVDHRLTWDPNTYGGDLDTTVVPQKRVWIPFLVNMLMYEKLEEIGNSEMNVRVDSNGKLTWVSPNIFESTCDADLSYYPFDSQTCSLRFYAPGFKLNELDLTPMRNTMDFSEYSENALWKVVETNIYTTTNNLNLQEIVMTVKMKRRSVYYISSLVLPVALLSFLQLSVYIMPPQCGERVGFATTVLLAVAVYLTLIQEKLPEGSEPSVSFLSYKLLGDFMVGVLITVGVVVGLRFYNREEDKAIPNYLKRFHKIILGGGFCQNRNNRKVAWNDKDTRDATEKELKSVPQEETPRSPLTWCDIGMATDRFCLMMFGFVLLNCNIVYIIVISSI